MFSSNCRTRSRFAPSLSVPFTLLLVSMAACGADERPRSSASGGTGSVPHTGGRAVGMPTGGRPATDGGAGAGGAPDSTGGVGSSGAPGSQGGAAPGGGAGSTSVDSGGGGQADTSGGTAGAGSAGEVGTGAAGAAGAAGAGGVASEPEPPQLNGCSTYLDRTAPQASRTVPWDASIAVSPERCMKIRAGQQVVFDGDFDAHPLEAFGGDTPSPFSGTPWLFDQPGAFGYICTIHSEMLGVIWVVP